MNQYLYIQNGNKCSKANSYHIKMKIGMKLLGLIVLITLSIAFLPQSGQCAKVAVIPMFGKSHVHVLNLMAQALIERGHDVSIAESVL